MRDCNQGRFRRQVRFLRRQFLQDDGLPFSRVLSEEMVEQALSAVKFVWNDSIYTPMVTLWVFLSQVLSADPSCRAAVARLIAHRVSQGQCPCSPESSAYCQARKRLPEKFFSTLTRLVGQTLDTQGRPEWLWKGRRVLMFDGTTVSMPDTRQNQRAYPQTDRQKSELGFPIARVGAITSLASGAILDLGFCRYAGKGQGEVTLLRRLSSVFSAGDILLTDCLLSNWRCIYSMKKRGVDMVSRLNKALRKADFRTGIQLGKEDHIVQWPKPWIRGLYGQAQKSMPKFITVREARVYITQPGFRTKDIIIVTTLLDPIKYPKEELADLYRQRWNNELDLRSIKSTMQMEILRCKTPELVRKEVWTHILAYNLIRTIIAQAASKHKKLPRSISFKGAIQTLAAFQPVIAIQGQGTTAVRVKLYQQLLDAIAVHQVADRPDRFEPRLRKRRPKHYAFLRKPRKVIKREMAKRLR